MKNCPGCSNLIENNDIFCPFCGFNLLTDSIIKKASNIPNPIMQIEMKPSTISKYQELEYQLQNLEGIEVELEQQETYIKNLNEIVKNAEKKLTQLSSQRYNEFKDVEKLKKISITSFVARIKRDRDTKIKKEELEYFDILNKEEAARNEVDRITQLIKKTDQQIKELNKLLQVKKDLSSKLEGLLYEVCEGVADPIEDEVEKKLLLLVNKINPINKEKQKFIRGTAHLKNACYDLEQALNLLQSAGGLANWDSFFGGGLFVDSMKHSKMADARNFVHRAQNEIQLANRELPELSVEGNATIEEISFFWDGFMDNIFSDFSARGKIQRSTESVNEALVESRNALTWVEKQLKNKDYEIEKLEDEIKETRKELITERKRMIEESIKTGKNF